MTKHMQALAFRVITILATIATLFSGSMASIALARHAEGVAAAPLAQGQGNCSSGFASKDESSPFTYTAPTGQVVTKVVVKAGSQNQGEACFTFTSNGSNGCYTVSGIGTRTATATKTGPDSPSCKDISHVEFHTQAAPSPTATPSPSPDPSPSPSPSPDPSPSPSPSPDPSPDPSPSPSASPSPSPDPSPDPSPSASPSPSPSVSPSPSASPDPGVRMSVTANCANEYNNNVRANVRIVVTGSSVTVDQFTATLEGTTGGTITYTPSDIVGRTLAPGTYDVQVLFRSYTLNSGVNDLRVRVDATFSGNQQTAYSPYFENCEVGPSPSPSASPSPSPSASPSPSPSASPSPSPSPSDSPSPSPSPSDSPSPSPSDSPSPSPSASPSPSPSPSSVPSPSASPSPSNVPSPSPSSVPSPSASPSPSPSDVPSPSASPSPSPSDVPSPSASPSPSTAPTTVPGNTPPTQQPPAQQPPAQQPPQDVGGVSDEISEQPRNEAVAGASDEISEQPRAVLPATGASEILTWLMLALASIMITVGSGIRAWQTRRF